MTDPTMLPPGTEPMTEPMTDLISEVVKELAKAIRKTGESSLENDRALLKLVEALIEKVDKMEEDQKLFVRQLQRKDETNG